MFKVLFRQLVVTLLLLAHEIRHPTRRRQEQGASTIEWTILILGGMGLAALLVAALFQKLDSLMAQLK